MSAARCQAAPNGPDGPSSRNRRCSVFMKGSPRCLYECSRVEEGHRALARCGGRWRRRLNWSGGSVSPWRRRTGRPFGQPFGRSACAGDYVSEFGLRRVLGKGGHEASVPLPEVARTIVSEYVATERSGAPPTEPLFVVRFKIKGGGWRQERMRDHRVFKIVKALGKQAGLAQLHPHAFRHSCGVELLRRTRGNLRAVQEHLRHSDIQTTTLYTRLTQDELQRVVSVFDRSGE